MDKQILIQRVNELNTREDLLRLLNELKTEDIGEHAYPFTMKQLVRYCNPNISRRRYTKFKIAKKSGGEREISAPTYGLKSMLKYVNVILQAMYEPLPCAMGFIPNRSVVDNASVHIGKHYVYNIDLKDFFPSVHRERVWKRLQFPPFNFSGERRVLADTIAGLCSMITDEKDNLGRPIFVLPQGAPTSPILTNIICEKMDRQLMKLANHYGLTYTRYADDITFSSSHNVYHKDGKFVKRLQEIITSQWFEINASKTRLCRINKRQEVTGLTVNVKVNVTRKYVQDIRHVLHAWKTKGYFEAYKDFFRHYKKEKGHIKKGQPVLENVISGKLEYLKMVKGLEDTTYLRLKSTFDKLKEQDKATNQQFANSSFRYIVSYPLAVFNDAFNTKVEFDCSDINHITAKCCLDGHETIIRVSSALSIPSEEHLCVISLCESADNNRFYLAHKPIEYDKIQSKNDQYLNETLERLVQADFTNLEILM